jgi:hypothetical protein
MPAEPVLPDGELRFRVLQLIADGRLPVMLSTTICAGYGRGFLCEVCAQPIGEDKIEYDVTLPGSDKCLHFHIACHFAWQRECARNPKADKLTATP